jgi:DNA polymerase III subunit delta'
MIFNWQESYWKRFLRIAQKMPHAILLHGPRGIGKFEFAKTAAALLLCQRAPAGAELRAACGECAACMLYAGGNHPDFFLVQPEADAAEATDADGEQAGSTAEEKKKKPSKQIRIDQVRQVLENI